MSIIDRETVKGLREIFGYYEKFDVFLAGPFELSERGYSKFDLYERVGEKVKKLGKNPFLPHRNIDLKWTNDKIYSIPNSIVIPTSDIMLAYLGLPSIAAGLMIGSAIENQLPIIYLYEKQEDFDQLKVRISSNRFIDIRKINNILEFDAVDVSRNLDGLEASLKRFYHLN